MDLLEARLVRVSPTPASGPVGRRTRADTWRESAVQSRPWAGDRRGIVAALLRGAATGATGPTRRHLLATADAPVDAAVEHARPPASPRRRPRRVGEWCRAATVTP